MTIPASTAVILRAGDLVDEKEAAGILGVKVGTIRNWRSLGQGPRFRKIGTKAIRYHRDDLAAFAGEPKQAAA